MPFRSIRPGTRTPEEDGPVAVVIVMAVQVDLYEENEVPQQQNAVS